jgi:hypothetical protein
MVRSAESAQNHEPLLHSLTPQLFVVRLAIYCSSVLVGRSPNPGLSGFILVYNAFDMAIANFGQGMDIQGDCWSDSRSSLSGHAAHPILTI